MIFFLKQSDCEYSKGYARKSSASFWDPLAEQMNTQDLHSGGYGIAGVLAHCPESNTSVNSCKRFKPFIITFSGIGAALKNSLG